MLTRYYIIYILNMLYINFINHKTSSLKWPSIFLFHGCLEGMAHWCTSFTDLGQWLQGWRFCGSLCKFLSPRIFCEEKTLQQGFEAEKLRGAKYSSASLQHVRFAVRLGRCSCLIWEVWPWCEVAALIVDAFLGRLAYEALFCVKSSLRKCFCV